MQRWSVDRQSERTEGLALQGGIGAGWSSISNNAPTRPEIPSFSKLTLYTNKLEPQKRVALGRCERVIGGAVASQFLSEIGCVEMLVEF